MPTPGRARRGGAVLFAVLAILSVGVLAGFVRASLIAPLHVPLDPNEGWNAYHAAAAMASGNPYPAPGSFMIDNYPPLSFYLIGALGARLGDNIVAGRLVSLAAFAGICVLLVCALRQMKSAWSAAAFAALLLAEHAASYFRLCRHGRPAALGHALQLAALRLFFVAPARSAKVRERLPFRGGRLREAQPLCLAACDNRLAAWLSIGGTRFGSLPHCYCFSLAGFVAV